MLEKLSPSKYQVHANLQPNGKDKLYVDRDYMYTNVGKYAGWFYIRSRNDDKRSSSGVSFDVDSTCDVCVLYDKRAKRVPKWMTDWRKTGDVVATQDTSFQVFSKSFGKGTVRLGSCECDYTRAKSMYTVLVSEASSGPDPPDEVPVPQPPIEDGKVPEAPDTAGLPVPGSPWNIVMSQEGSKKSLWDDKKTKQCLDDGIAKWKDGVLEWYPRYCKKDGKKWDNWDGNPSSTVWRMFPKTDLRRGVSVKMQMYSPMDKSLPRVDYSDSWSPEEEASNLRRVAGTGDFRVGLIQTGGERDMGKWHAYQVRLYPYLHREAKKHIGASDTSNCSYWYREKPGAKDCLMDDYSQDDDRDGFKKLRHDGELKFGMGPHSPYDTWIDVEIKLKMNGNRISSSVRVHNDTVVLDSYEHETRGFDSTFEHVDAVCLSFNNMRPYAGIKLKCMGW